METLTELWEMINELWDTNTRHARGYIRLALIILLLWPIVAILFATINHKFALVAIPFWGLVLIGAVVVLIYYYPIITAVAAAYQRTRPILQDISLVIGFELFIGLYFAFVPVDNNRKLIPIFVVVCITLLLFTLGTKIAWSGFIKFAMTVIIIVITVFFYRHDKQQEQPVPTTTTQTATQQQPKQAEWVKDQESGLMVKQTSHEVVPKGGAKIKQSVEDGRGPFTTDCKNSPLNLGIDVAPGEEIEIRHIVENIAKMNRCSYDMRGNAHPIAEAASMIVMDRWRNEIFFSDLPPYSYVFSLGKPGDSQIAKIFESDGEHITLQNNTNKTLPLYFTFNYINKKDWMRQVGWDGSSISFEAVKL